MSTWIDAGPVEISPDGTRLVFTARKGEAPNLLWVRALRESTARPLAGTEGAQRPFWSPDGQLHRVLRRPLLQEDRRQRRSRLHAGAGDGKPGRDVEPRRRDPVHAERARAGPTGSRPMAER